jgi:hypothetical protein
LTCKGNIIFYIDILFHFSGDDIACYSESGEELATLYGLRKINPLRFIYILESFVFTDENKCRL